MTCSSAFLKRNCKNLKTVSLTFFKMQSILTLPHKWLETLIDSLAAPNTEGKSTTNLNNILRFLLIKITF